MAFNEREQLFTPPNRKRDTITPATKRSGESFLGHTPVFGREHFGLSRENPWEIATGPLASGVLPGALDAATRPFRTIAEGVSTGLEVIPSSLGGTVSDISGTVGRGIDALRGNKTLFGEYAGSPGTTSPSVGSGSSAAEHIVARTQAAAEVADIEQQLANVPLSFEHRNALEQRRLETEAELDQITQDLDRLAASQASIQENFDFGSALLEAQGLPSSIASAREDPTIAAAIDKVDAAIESGNTDDLDAAIDAMASLNEDTLDAVGQVFGREEYLAEMQMNIKNEMHNLVQNRQNIEQNQIAYEDWIEKDAQAQELNLFDFQGDPSPVGRGFDAIINDVQPWLEQNFSGIMTVDQEDQIARALNNIWQNSLSDQPVEILDEEGNPTGEFEERPDMTAEMEQGLFQLATVGATDAQGNPIPGLGFTQQQAMQFVAKVKAAVERGRTVTDQVDAWEESEFLEPGSPQLSAGIYEVAEELNKDPEIAEQFAKSDFLHRLIMMRSGGDVNFTGGGNQFGLGALPEHTYEKMGYEMADLRGNPKEQIEALLTYIQYWQYGVGYEGLQAAVADMLHNPNTWGDITSG